MQEICSPSAELHAHTPARWHSVCAALFAVVMGMGMSACGGGGGSDDSPTAPKTWQVAERIEADAEHEAEDPQVAMDAAGNAIAVWEQSDGTRINIWANRYVAGVGWGTAQLLGTDNAGDATGPTVGMDAAGNAVAVWQQFDGTRTNVWANRYTVGAGWGAPELIEDLGSEAFNPQVAVGRGGHAVAAWTQEFGTRTHVVANRYTPGAGWEQARAVENNAPTPFAPRLAVDIYGNAVVVWWQGDDIWSNRYTTGAAWGSAELIEADPASASSPKVAVDASGNVMAVWEQNAGPRRSIWANRFTPNAGWGTPQLIENDDAGRAGRLGIAGDANGNVVAVWARSEGVSSTLWSNRYTVAEGWGVERLIGVENLGNALAPQLAGDAAGNAVVVWQQLSSGGRSDLWTQRYTAGADWGLAELLETDDTDDAVEAQIAVGGDGHAVAVWFQRVGGTAGVWARVFR